MLKPKTRLLVAGRLVGRPILMTRNARVKIVPFSGYPCGFPALAEIVGRRSSKNSCHKSKCQKVVSGEVLGTVPSAPNASRLAGAGKGCKLWQTQFWRFKGNVNRGRIPDLAAVVQRVPDHRAFR